MISPHEITAPVRLCSTGDRASDYDLFKGGGLVFSSHVSSKIYADTDSVAHLIKYFADIKGRMFQHVLNWNHICCSIPKLNNQVRKITFYNLLFYKIFKPPHLLTWLSVCVFACSVSHFFISSLYKSLK